MLYFLVVLLFIQAALSQAATQPIVQVCNGTIQGLHSDVWKQDFFLGIPYAQPPVSDLRFRAPQPINRTYEGGLLEATSYGYSCYQYGSKLNISEDCLTLNIVRPSGFDNASLPVLLWIHGGGLVAGSAAEAQYNLSGCVNTSTGYEDPYIAISINYRLGIWGFLASPIIVGEGSSNAGLLDQRLAMQWVQENIAAFGGDPTRVTIWGESAGAQSIGWHLHSYNGRNDRLYRAAILESGGPVGVPLNSLSFYNAPYQSLAAAAGCSIDWTNPTSLACLRNLSSKAFFSANHPFATQWQVVWNPIIDGTLLTSYPSHLAATGHFIRVPLLLGANTDEGISFSISAINTTAQLSLSLLTWRSYALLPTTIRTLLHLYPDSPATEPPYALHNATLYPSRGLQWRRTAAIGGDMAIIAGRRRLAAQYAPTGAWSYRFNAVPYHADPPDSVAHAVNIPYSFQNISGGLGPAGRRGDKALSVAIGRAYAAFVARGDPNAGGLPGWPRYDTVKPTNMVLQPGGSYVEADTFRTEGIGFINSIARELLA